MSVVNLEPPEVQPEQKSTNEQLLEIAQILSDPKLSAYERIAGNKNIHHAYWVGVHELVQLAMKSEFTLRGTQEKPRIRHIQYARFVMTDMAAGVTMSVVASPKFKKVEDPLPLGDMIAEEFDDYLIDNPTPYSVYRPSAIYTPRTSAKLNVRMVEVLNGSPYRPLDEPVRPLRNI